MKKFSKEKLRKIQILIIGLGVLWSWFNVIKQGKIHYEVEGSLTKIKDCAVTNPILTPCFWGAVAFLISFVLSILIIKAKKQKSKKFQGWLKKLTFVGTLFAWAVVGSESYDYFSNKMQPIQTCTGIVKNPLESACFVGAIIFTLSFLISTKIFKKSEEIKK